MPVYEAGKFLDDFCNLIGRHDYEQKIKDTLNVHDNRASRRSGSGGRRVQIKKRLFSPNISKSQKFKIRRARAQA